MAIIFVVFCDYLSDFAIFAFLSFDHIRVCYYL